MIFYINQLYYFDLFGAILIIFVQINYLFLLFYIIFIVFNN